MFKANQGKKRFHIFQYRRHFRFSQSVSSTRLQNKKNLIKANYGFCVSFIKIVLHSIAGKRGRSGNVESSFLEKSQQLRVVHTVHIQSAI